jgi:hypothetical protein
MAMHGPGRRGMRIEDAKDQRRTLCGWQAI